MLLIAGMFWLQKHDQRTFDLMIFLCFSFALWELVAWWTIPILAACFIARYVWYMVKRNRQFDAENAAS